MIDAWKKEYFNKWGQHFVLSFMTALQQQIKNNFKDKAVSYYGGEMFTALADKIDETFNTLPAPEPSLKGQSN